MFSKIATRAALLVTGVVGIAGFTGAARANTLFTNLTGETVHFTTSCAGASGTDAWRVAPHSTGSLYCKAGESSMQVTIRTDRGPVDHVVRATVLDGHSYDLGFDDDGDVSIARRS